MDDLAGFLRTRRSRVDPAAAGIPTDSRRRVQGLRREEVAHLSGVSVDYYVRLEQGRATQPSEQGLEVVGHLRLAAGKYPEDPRLASLIGELAMGSERFRRLWARADVRARTHGRKAYRHPLVGLLELHHENFALPDESGMELLVLSAVPGSPAEDALRLLAGLGADSGAGHPAVNAQAREQKPATP
ncbi:helix-turn-helix domain-containing protein [Streptomyces sp. XH2]|uniref:MmyB family transcriptional regulator n=1 Tax=Streptomyces sp. XH2 TaxID=3412483 RepID=UPI003C7D075B